MQYVAQKLLRILLALVVPELDETHPGVLEIVVIVELPAHEAVRPGRYRLRQQERPGSSAQRDLPDR